MLERITISFFGRTNTGKSSLINALTNQDVSIVSDIQGTTTDPVKKVMELLPIGPVTIIDTPGLDDSSELGTERIKKAVRVLDSTQIAVLVTDSTDSDSRNFSYEENLISEFKKRQIPFLIAVNKCDENTICKNSAPSTRPFDGAQGPRVISIKKLFSENLIFLSAKNGRNINLLKDKLGELYKKITKLQINKPLVRDLIPQNSTIILVIPIDEAAPKDRLILPQQ
ncbi:MAG: 50S ribosome-binding GTPase, partial [Treponema sp.]|nr:50S ribosome-binding GTPase [Treponema sp.]